MSGHPAPPPRRPLTIHAERRRVDGPLAGSGGTGVYRDGMVLRCYVNDRQVGWTWLLHEALLWSNQPPAEGPD